MKGEDCTWAGAGLASLLGRDKTSKVVVWRRLSAGLIGLAFMLATRQSRPTKCIMGDMSGIAGVCVFDLEERWTDNKVCSRGW